MIAYTHSGGATLASVKKAFSYIRFSTSEQAKGDSLRRQKKLSEDYAKKHGLALDTSLRLQDLGISGFSGKNVAKGALGAFLKAVEAGRIEKGAVLLVESLDRISRAEITEQMTLFMNLINSGIEIVTLADGMRFSKASINDNFSNLMYSLMSMSRGYEESAIKSKRLKAAWEGKRASGKALTALCPAWLRLKADRSGYERIPERCEIVKRIFKLARNGMGKDLIAKSLTKEGVPTWGVGKQGNAERVAGWYQSYIRKILSNRAVIGEYQPHKMQEGRRVPVGDPVSGYFPAIISLADFQAIESKRQVMNFGRKSETVSTLFTGLAKCGYTGAPMVYVNKGKWRYLVSSTAKRGAGGAYVSWPYEHFETAFLTFLTELNFAELFDESWKATHQASADALAAALDNLGKVKKSITKLTDALLETDAPPKAIVTKLAELEANQEELEKEVAEIRRTNESAEKEAREAANTQDAFKTMMAKRGDVPTRFKLQQHIREHVARIDLYAAGKPKMVTLRGKPFKVDWNKALASYFITASTKNPAKAFVVTFKTGAQKFVVTDENDASKLVSIMKIEGGKVQMLLPERTLAKKVPTLKKGK